MRRSQAQWERYCTADLPADIATRVLVDAQSRYGAPVPESSSPWYPYNQRLIAHRNAFRAANIHRAYDPVEIRTYADNAAGVCRRIEPTWPTLREQFRCLERRAAIAAAAGIEPPAERNYTLYGRLKRLENPYWWRRQLRKVWTRGAETQCRAIGLVRRGEQPYVTHAAVRHRQAQDASMGRFLQSRILINERSEQVSLSDVAEHSLANLGIRRGELMTRMRGFEEVAQLLGHRELAITLTAPSAFHAQLKAGGTNPRWQKFTPREAQQWLSRQWARARSKIKRAGVMVYGFRIAEPHHDATPHWHVLLAGTVQALRVVCASVYRAWMSEYADEPGARKIRVKFKRIDPSKGGAAGYIAKYVSKNIDGAGSIGAGEDLETGTDVHASVIRVRTWASTHGIRQFQQIGGPPVGLWREARRCRNGAKDPDIAATVKAADTGDWCRFVFNVGGIRAGRRTNITLRKEETGAVNQFGEFKGKQIVGLQCASAIEYTRPHRWRIEKCQSELSLSLPPPQVPQSDFSSAAALACSADIEFSQLKTKLNAINSALNSAPRAAHPIRRHDTESFSDSESGSRSSLGPVAITVRDGRFAIWEYDPAGLPVLRWYRCENEHIDEYFEDSS